MPDTDVLEQDSQIEGGETQQQDAPVTSLPDHAAGEKAQTRQELIDATLEEGASAALQESIIDELGDATKHPELTVDDLRKLPGADGMTDEQLKTEWAKAVATAQGSQVVDGQAADKTFKLPFPVYDAQGQKIDALEKISVRDLLEGKIQIGYNALGKEQRKTLAEALRNASMGHWNEQKYNTTVEERNRVASTLAERDKEIAQFSSERKVWDTALTALAMGNPEPIKALATAYQKALTSTVQPTPGMVPVEQVKAEQEQVERGTQYRDQVLYPAASDIAKRYDANPQEVYNAIKWYIEREPAQFLTHEKIQSIIAYDVPALFESNGYSANATGAQPAAQPNEVEELKKTVAALQTSIADKKNASTQQVREKAKKAPPAGGGAVPGAGDSMPSFKNRAQMKAWMNGDEDWQKA